MRNRFKSALAVALFLTFLLVVAFAFTSCSLIFDTQPTDPTEEVEKPPVNPDDDPSDTPTIDDPNIDKPSGDDKPTDDPSEDDKPSDNPNPPVDTPSEDDKPTDDPIDKPGGDDKPTDDPSEDDKPSDNPNPPVDNPSEDDKPTDDPIDKPSGDDKPTDDPVDNPSEDDKPTDNPDDKPELPVASGGLGSTTSVTASPEWDLQYDFAADSADYADRKISVSKNGEHDVAFKSAKGGKLFVQAHFKLSTTENGKAGIMLFDGANRNGVFYFVKYGADGCSLGASYVYNGVERQIFVESLSGTEFELYFGYRGGIVSVWYGTDEGAVLVRQFAYIAENAANIGFKSIDCGVEISGYSVFTDSNTELFKQYNPAIISSNGKILLVSDSAESNFASSCVTADLTFINEDIGYLSDKNIIATAKAKYNTEKLIIDIGKTSDFDKLTALISGYAAAFENSDIYFLTAIPSKDTAGKIAETVSRLKDFAAESGKINIIDVYTPFINADGELRNILYTEGKLNGYGSVLFNYCVGAALGVKHNDGKEFGFNEFANLCSTDGWIFDDGCPLKTESKEGERVAFYKNTDFSENVLFEADIAADNGGAVLFNERYCVAAYINGGKAGIVYRENLGAWVKLSEIDGNFGSLGIVKYDGKYYLLGDGEVVSQVEIPQIGSSEKFIAGIIALSGSLEVNAAKCVTDNQVIFDRLLKPHAITSDAELNINKTRAKAGESIVFSVLSQKIISRVILSCGGSQTELSAENGVYSFTMPDCEAEITVITAVRVDLSQTDGKISANTELAEVGSEVVFAAAENYFIKELFVNGELLEPTDGEYKILVIGQTEDMSVTATLLFTNGGVLLDGIADGAYGEVKSGSEVEGIRAYSISAVKVSGGVWIFATATTDGECTGIIFEFILNGGELLTVGSQTASEGVTQFTYNVTCAEKYLHTFEIFVGNVAENDGDIRINYGFVVPNEAAYILTEKVISPDLIYVESWCGHAIGGIGEVLPENLFVTENGLKIVGTSASNGKIDGNLEEFAGMNAVSFGDKNLPDTAYGDLTAYTADDGLYIGITVNHGDWAAINPIWELNDNIRIDIGGTTVNVLFIDGKLQYGLPIAECAASTALNLQNYVTTVELFIPVAGSSLRFKTAGEGFGTSTVMWDSQYCLAVTPTGIDVPVNVDGTLNDSIWTNLLENSYGYALDSKKYVEIAGANIENGALLAFTVAHDLVLDSTQTVRIAYGGEQIEISPFNTEQESVLYSYTTTANNSDKWLSYTTVYEIFVPFALENITISAVIDGEQYELFGGAFTVTASGLSSENILGCGFKEEVWTEQVKYSSVTDSVGTASVTTTAVKDSGGVWLYYKIDSMTSIFECHNKKYPDSYNSYMYLWINIDDVAIPLDDPYITIAAYKNVCINAKMGYRVTYNGEAAEPRFTTECKIFVSFEIYYNLVDEDMIPLYTMATADGSTKWIGGSESFMQTNSYITTNGIVSSI